MSINLCYILIFKRKSIQRIVRLQAKVTTSSKQIKQQKGEFSSVPIFKSVEIISWYFPLTSV